MKELLDRYESLFKNNASAMLLTDPENGRIIDANDAAIEFYGYESKIIKTMNIYDINTMTKEEINEEMKKAKRNRKRHFNFKHRLSNGTIKNVEVYSGPIDIEGKTYLYSIIHDITERNEIENKLKEEKNFSQTLIETSNAIIVTTNKNFETTLVNDYFEKLTGIKKENILGKDTIKTLTSSEERDSIYQLFEDIFNGKRDNSYTENILYSKDGTKNVIAWKDSLLKSEIYGDQILSVGIDITDLKKNEEKTEYKLKLESSLNKIREIIDENQLNNYGAISEILFKTINISRFEIIEFSNKLNNHKKIIYEYSKDGKKQFKEQIETAPSETTEYWENYLLENRTVEFSNTTDLSENFILKDFVEKNNIKSFITIPVILNNKVFATITFNLFEDTKEFWRAEDVNYLKKIAEILEKEFIRVTHFKKVKKTLNDTVNTLSSVVETKDAYTASHQMRVAELSVAIAKKMGLDEETINTIEISAKLHDIGKIYIPSDILNKPGKISDIEFSLIKKHSELGYDILKTIDFDMPIAEIVIQHHERIDGTGYPFGLKADEIRLEAKILAVADTVEAMDSHRPYRKALGIDKALNEIGKNSGTRYDALVVKNCLELFKVDQYQLAIINNLFQ